LKSAVSLSLKDVVCLRSTASNTHALIERSALKRGKIVLLKRNICSLLFIFAFSTTAAFAQATGTSSENHPQRSAILEALRGPVSKDLKQKITFSTEKLRVQGDWAFVSGRARNSEGGHPNWKLTKYQKFIDSGDFEDNLFALLKKSNDKWSVVTYMMSCQDVCYLGWDEEYKAPKALFEDGAASQPPVSPSEAQEIEGELEVGKTESVILYVGMESGDYAAYCFTNNSEAGRKILAACKNKQKCSVNGTVSEYQCKVPGLEADLSASGKITKVQSVKSLGRKK
jgi:hypothetical protein